MYTQAWDSSKATNNGQYRGSDRYTISNSVMATNATDSGDVSCPQDVPYLSANGQEFCTAYLNYVPPVVINTAISTPATSVLTSIYTQYATEMVSTVSTTTDVTLTTTTVTKFQKRDVATPASAVSWSPSRLSKACAAVATGVTTTVTTQTAATPLTTFLTTASQTTTLTVVSTTTTSATSVIENVFAPTATTLGTNLVVNPGFEAGGQGWSGPTGRCNNYYQILTDSRALSGSSYG